MARVSTSLDFNGDAEEAMEFSRSVFGSEFGPMMRMGDLPPNPDMPELSDADKQLVMHVALPILGDHILMATDMTEPMGHVLEIGNTMTLNLEPDTSPRRTASSMPSRRAAPTSPRWRSSSGERCGVCASTGSVSGGCWTSPRPSSRSDLGQVLSARERSAVCVGTSWGFGHPARSRGHRDAPLVRRREVAPGCPREPPLDPGDHLVRRCTEGEERCREERDVEERACTIVEQLGAEIW